MAKADELQVNGPMPFPSSPTKVISDLADPVSPFASPDALGWDRSNGAVTKAKPSSIPRAKLPSFNARQLSFRDWCFTPAAPSSGNDDPTRKVQLSMSSVDLHPLGPQGSEVSWIPQPSMMQNSAVSQPVKTSQDTALIEDTAADILSCNEALLYSHSVDYAVPASKRRRSCSVW